MKALYIIIIFCSVLSHKAVAQDTTISDKDLPAYIGRKVTILMRVLDFDIRKDYIYLYMGGWYPRQSITVIIKRNNGKRHIRVNKNVILGREMAAITGFISTYDGEPDTTKNYDDDAVKKEFEKAQPVEIYALHIHGMMSHKYKPRTAPIDLRGKLAMLITQQRQISVTTYQFLHDSSNDIIFPSVISDTRP